jgi:hypothetical protein
MNARLSSRRFSRIGQRAGPLIVNTVEFGGLEKHLVELGVASNLIPLSEGCGHLSKPLTLEL